MLGHLVSRAPQLIRPYIAPILRVLIPKLKEVDATPAVTISILAAVGDLAQVCCSSEDLVSIDKVSRDRNIEYK